MRTVMYLKRLMQMQNSNEALPRLASDAMPPIKLLQQVTAYRTTQCIRAAVELGLASILEKGPLGAAQLATSTQTHEDYLTRVLDHLVNEGVFGKDDERRYFNTATSRFLLPDTPFSLHDWIKCELHPLYWRAWENSVEQLRTHKPAFDLTHGSPFFEWLAQDEMAQKRFDREMRSASLAMGSSAAQNLQFAAGEVIIDVGGGDGSLLARILAENPGTTGILFELPRTDAIFNPLFEDMIADGRAKVEHGSFLDSIPGGGNAYLFSRVFHDFSDETVSRILENTRKVLKGHERLVIVDMMINPDKPRPGASSQDMLMMVLLGGKERTSAEFEDLLTSNGFTDVKVTPTGSPLSILEFKFNA